MATAQLTDSTVIVVEDDSSMRGALETLMTSANFRCLSFASGEAFLAEPLPRAPCCLVLDMQLGGQSGLEVQRQLHARRADLPVLFVSGDDSIDRAVSAMKAGAIDFVRKPFDPDKLLASVEHALQRSIDGYALQESIAHDRALLDELTQREQEIAQLLADGNDNKDMARMLDLSVRTVETHRMHIMDKLQARTAADMVRVWLNGRGDHALAQRSSR